MYCPFRYQDIPGLAPPSGKEYFPLGSVAEKRPLPTLAGTIHKGRPHQGGGGRVGPKADIVREVAWI